jgi:hypothetical protein
MEHLNKEVTHNSKILKGHVKIVEAELSWKNKSKKQGTFSKRPTHSEPRIEIYQPKYLSSTFKS